MKSLLMHKDCDFDMTQSLPWQKNYTLQDLELNTIIQAMSNNDDFIADVSKIAILSAAKNSASTITYRQEVLKDCLKNPETIKKIYEIADDLLNEEENHWLISRYPKSIMHRSITLLDYYFNTFRKLRHIALSQLGNFKSDGFINFFTTIISELSDEYINEVDLHLNNLKFDDGELISAKLGKGNKGTHYMLRRSNEPAKGWLRSLLTLKSKYSYDVYPGDEIGLIALSDMAEKGINTTANVLAQSADNILSYFKQIKTELGFYIGCINLYEQLSKYDMPISFPTPIETDHHVFKSHELYDACLALKMKSKIVTNDIMADQKSLIIITGANQGGKSTFLRSLGLAQLMMQSGMFVAASLFSATLCDNLFTHYKREEDTTMVSGKFDEELKRMSNIVDHLTKNSIILFNEAFAATNDREGSEIAKQIVSALIKKNIKIFFVTHLFEFAYQWQEMNDKHVLFLRAERQADGMRTYKLFEGKPLQTSYGDDLFKSIFDH